MLSPDAPLTPEAPMSEKSLRTAKILVAVVLAGLWAFVLWLQVFLARYRYFPSAEVPDPGSTRIAWGVGIIVVTVLVGALTTWFTRRLGPVALAVIHISAMSLLVILSW